MKRTGIGILTILAFVASFLLASYFSDHGVSLYAQLNKTIHWVESLFSDAPELNKTPVNTGQTITNLQPKKQFQHVEVGNAGACKDTSLGEVKYKKVGDVYSWIDEKGIANFSSTPPNRGEFELLNYAGEKVFDYFSLDLNTASLPYDFNQRLTLKLNKLFKLYGQLLDSSSLKKVDINLRVYASEVAFNQIKAKHNMPIGDNTPGFYSHGSNQAHLLLTNQAATMRTATHEATHAINRGIIGYSPKWLNEGLAEYSEYIEVKGQVSSVYPNKSWTNNNRISEKLLPLHTLLSATNSDWDSPLRNRLYATSWAFIYFMMDNQQRKGMLAKAIKSEQHNLCNINSLQQVEQVMGIPVKGLQRQFDNWTGLKLKAHNI